MGLTAIVLDKDRVIANGTHADACDWLHFASRASPAGRDWAAEYMRYASYVELTIQALELMQRGQTDKGAVLLEQFARFLGTFTNMLPSIRAVMDRWYYGVAAYYNYCIRDFNAASKAMFTANEAIVQALSQEDFLILLAVHCQEFCLHQARIARNDKNWEKMYGYLDQARAMTEDQLPLCKTQDGQPIFFSSISSFLHSLGPLSLSEQESVRYLVQIHERRKAFEKFVSRLMRIPNFAIQYP
jgi:hypothetical protein